MIGVDYYKQTGIHDFFFFTELIIFRGEKPFLHLHANKGLQMEWRKDVVTIWHLWHWLFSQETEIDVKVMSEVLMSNVTVLTASLQDPYKNRRLLYHGQTWPGAFYSRYQV